jgi:hypothetical protein
VSRPAWSSRGGTIELVRTCKETTIRNILYFIGAGLTKSLEMSGWAVPAMWDFTSTMADYVGDDIVLTTMAELENAGLYQHKSDEAAKLAARVVGKSADRSPAARSAFRDALKNRSPESIEDLLERSLWLSGNLAAELAHQRFKYAISRLFCLVGWNINRGPLDRFLQIQIGRSDTRHTFVSFNYDLILDGSVQKTSPEWKPDAGYGFNIPFYVADDLPPTEKMAGTLDFVRAIPFASATASTITILKPHGSLNWLVPYVSPYAQTPQGVKFLDMAPIVPMTTSGSVRYWCSSHNFQYIALPDEMPTQVGVCILPPSSAKQSELSFVRTSREAESAALASADEVVVIGWSVPETDIDQAELIERTVKARNKPLQSLTVVNRNAPSTYFERLARLFGVDSRSLRIYNSGFIEFTAVL